MFRGRYSYFLLFFFFFTLEPVAIAETPPSMLLRIEGLQGDVKDNVKARLSDIKPEEVNSSTLFRRHLSDEIEKGLRPFGYYQPNIAFKLDYKAPPQASTLIVEVQLGQPIKIANVHVLLHGAGARDPDYLRLLKRDIATEGDTLNHQRYENFKQKLNDIALSKGYFNAKLTRHKLFVSPPSKEAKWDIVFDTGDRFRFGDVELLSSQIDEQYVKNIMPFNVGELYSADKLAEYNRLLSSSNWFQSVIVAPRFSQATADHRLPIQIYTYPQVKNTLEFGLGYATDTGIRTKATWTRPWVNDKGQSFRSSLALSGIQQSIDFAYKLPLLKAPLEQYYLLQSGIKRENNKDTRSDSYSFDVGRYWQLSTGWQRVLNFKTTYDSFTQGMDHYDTFLLMPGMSFSRTRQQGSMMPTWGDSQRYSLDFSNHIWASDIDFVVFQAQNTWIRTFFKKHRFIVRGNFGWIETNNFSRVPPSLRFFAGGDRSIRGYGYKSIAPRDSSGKLEGASKLAVGSIEYQYQLTPSWWGAIFIDSGEAVDRFSSSAVKSGAGFGIRWASPVGPVRFDLARPITHGEPRKWHFYFGIGAEL